MAGQATSVQITVTYAKPEVAARTAALVVALGPTSGNAADNGNWVTSWGAIDFSTNKKTDALYSLFAEVIGSLASGVTVTLVVAL